MTVVIPEAVPFSMGGLPLPFFFFTYALERSLYVLEGQVIRSEDG
jgi:hypothetical protein